MIFSDLFVLNKYTAFVIIFIIILVVYYYKKKYIKNIVKKKSSKKGGKSKSVKKSVRFQKKEEDDEPEDDADADDDDDIDRDAEELYNLAHDRLCTNISSEEFDELTGDLANATIYIELRQLYNQCNQKGLDPNKTIKVKDYIKILRDENV